MVSVNILNKEASNLIKGLDYKKFNLLMGKKQEDFLRINHLFGDKDKAKELLEDIRKLWEMSSSKQHLAYHGIKIREDGKGFIFNPRENKFGENLIKCLSQLSHFLTLSQKADRLSSLIMQTSVLMESVLSTHLGLSMALSYVKDLNLKKRMINDVYDKTETKRRMQLIEKFLRAIERVSEEEDGKEVYDFLDKGLLDLFERTRKDYEKDFSKDNLYNTLL
jgi:hypothetical protein